MNTQEVTTTDVQPVRESTLAIISLVAGITGWTVFPVIGGIVAIITGHLALNEIRDNEGQLRGNSLAIGGLALGYVCLACFALIVLALVSGIFYFGMVDFVF